jgi:hypothetical protein
MHRIDGPGATVDNKFTDGDPVGGIQATLVTDDWLNDVQENIMAVLAAAGVSPTKGRAADLLDAIRGSGAGIVGGARNAKMSVATASATATFTASELLVETALGGQAFKLANFSKTINLATTGAGGMDTGTAPTTLPQRWCQCGLRMVALSSPRDSRQTGMFTSFARERSTHRLSKPVSPYWRLPGLFL